MQDSGETIPQGGLGYIGRSLSHVELASALDIRLLYSYMYDQVSTIGQPMLRFLLIFPPSGPIYNQAIACTYLQSHNKA